MDMSATLRKLIREAPENGGVVATDTLEDWMRLLMAMADCRRRFVSALIVREGGYLLGAGWNSPPDGSCLDGDCPRGLLTYEEQPAFVGYEATGCTALHAEERAIKMAMRTVGPRVAKIFPQCLMYITCEPCERCRNHLTRYQLPWRVVELSNATRPRPNSH